MYNRYIRNDHGTYTRVPEEDAARPESAQKPTSPPGASAEQSPPSGGSQAQASPPFSPFTASQRGMDSVTGSLRRLLDRFHLENIDTGDLLLLLLLFLLFEEDADEELLIALGLLLVL